uniref:SDS3 homolog, SIN3A corepressor complex component n=1 Tax=Echeneis naucrates TaxID=173247 RepID=A0A665T4F9_ECHNA
MASTLISPMVDYYNDEEELDSVDDEDDRSFRGRDSEEDTEDASETDLAKHDEDDYVEIKEQMYQDKLASLKRQLQQLQEGTLQEYQKRMKKLDQQYKERLRNTEQVERNYIKEKKAAVKEFDDKKVELKENLIADPANSDWLRLPPKLNGPLLYLVQAFFFSLLNALSH